MADKQSELIEELTARNFHYISLSPLTLNTKRLWTASVACVMCHLFDSYQSRTAYSFHLCPLQSVETSGESFSLENSAHTMNPFVSLATGVVAPSLCKF